jgi:hypothetical protein
MYTHMGSRAHVHMCTHSYPCDAALRCRARASSGLLQTCGQCRRRASLSHAQESSRRRPTRDQRASSPFSSCWQASSANPSEAHTSTSHMHTHSRLLFTSHSALLHMHKNQTLRVMGDVKGHVGPCGSRSLVARGFGRSLHTELRGPTHTTDGTTPHWITHSPTHLLCALRHIVMENVKGFEESETRDHFTRVLSESGYQFQEYLLSPEQIGIPNSRLRYYLVATRGSLPAPPTATVLTDPPSSLSTSSPPAVEHGDGAGAAEADVSVVAKVADGQGAVVKRRRVASAAHHAACRSIRDYLDPAVDKDPRLAADYELDAKTVCRLTRVLDIVTPDSTRSMCFTKAYGSYAEVRALQRTSPLSSIHRT